MKFKKTMGCIVHMHEIVHMRSTQYISEISAADQKLQELLLAIHYTVCLSCLKKSVSEQYFISITAPI